MDSEEVRERRRLRILERMNKSKTDSVGDTGSVEAQPVETKTVNDTSTSSLTTETQHNTPSSEHKPILSIYEKYKLSKKLQSEEVCILFKKKNEPTLD